MELENNTEHILNELNNAVLNHNKLRSDSLNLIASESILWDSTSLADYVDLTRRAILGIPNERYSEGGKYIDIIENITEKLLKESFKASFAEWRPISGSIADGVLIHALTSVSDPVLATPTPLGHPTWHENGYAGFRGLKLYDTPYDWNNLEPDYKKLEEFTSDNNMKLIIEGSSLILFPPDFKKLKEASNGIPIWYDGAHILGLIIGNKFPNPLNYGINALSGSTQKTMAGPLGGVILTNNENMYKTIVKATSNDMATPDYSRYVMLSKVLLNWKSSGNSLAKNITENAKTLAEELVNCGMRVILEERGYTSTHQIGLVAPGDMSSEMAAKRLSMKNIITTPFPLPKEAKYSNVLRLGVTELTQMGATEEDMKIVARIINGAFTNDKDSIDSIKKLLGTLKAERVKL